ncbi:MAG: hypothetical protein HDR74_06765 [Bacteroides sp.]|nr:hypothetical protein [Bacteroides sp.]
MSVVITQEQLAKSAAKYRKELLKLPVLALAPILKYMTLRTGIRDSETVGELAGSFEFGPYDRKRRDESDITISPRTLQVFLGNAVKCFDPNDVVSSIYGSSITNGDGLKKVDIVTQVVSFLCGKLGEGLARHIFDAVRDAGKTDTKSLFNGFDTILLKEITDGNVSEDKGNLFKFAEAITADNAVDMITSFCRAAHDELLGVEDGADANNGLYLFVPRQIVYNYRDDYKTTTGHSPIYDEFNQMTVEGFPNIRFVPAAGKAKSKIIQLTSRKNSLVGVNGADEREKIEINKYHNFELDFAATMFFGTQYESIAPERILVGELAAN